LVGAIFNAIAVPAVRTPERRVFRDFRPAGSTQIVTRSVAYPPAVTRPTIFVMRFGGASQLSFNSRKQKRSTRRALLLNNADVSCRCRKIFPGHRRLATSPALELTDRRADIGNPTHRVTDAVCGVSVMVLPPAGPRSPMDRVSTVIWPAASVVTVESRQPSFDTRSSP
jgi:hypothetical protein